MYVPPKKIGQRSPAVLCISRSCAEWLEFDAANEPKYGRAALMGTAPHELARAALDARKAAGGNALRPKLALGSGLILHRVLALPTLSKKELREVIERRTTATQGEVDDGYYFTARDVGGLPDGERNWLSTAVEREFITKLLVQLRRRRLRVRGIAVCSLAALYRAGEFTADGESASIAITIDENSIEVSLIAEGVLISSESLEGNLQENSHLISSVLQTVRSVAAFWRKSRGGAEVARVRVFGMTSERGAFLEQAIAGALPGAQAQCDQGPTTDSDDSERISTLSACLSDHPIAPNFMVPLPLTRKAEVIGLSACAGALLLGFAIVSRAVEGPRRELMQEIAQLEDESAKLPILREVELNSGQAISSLERRVNRASRVHTSGIDYRNTMADLLGAFGDRAAVLSVSVGAENDGIHEVTLSGVTESASIDSLLRIQGIENALAELPGVSNIRIDVPTRMVGAGEESSNGLRFSINVSLEGAS